MYIVCGDSKFCLTELSPVNQNIYLFELNLGKPKQIKNIYNYFYSLIWATKLFNWVNWGKPK